MKKKEYFNYRLYDEQVPVIIERKKIKNTYIRVKGTTIHVSTNRFVFTKQILRLIEKNKDKIMIKLEENKKKVLPSNKIQYLGHIINVSYKQGTRFHYQLKENGLVITSTLSNDEALARFYKEEAEQLFYERLKVCYDIFNKRHPISYPDLSIRKMKVRYGTCYYHKNKIVLNVMLMKSAIDQIDFVIFHELTHFIHHNHSQLFYDTLAYFVPAHRLLKEDLNKL